MEGESHPWFWMALALLALAGNLVFPRWRGLKLGALAFLLLAAYSYAGTREVQIVRALNMVERHPDSPVSPAEWLRTARAAVAEAFFDLWLALVGGVLFALIPADAIGRLALAWSRHRQSRTPNPVIE